MFNNYKDPSGYYNRHPSYDDINQRPTVPKEGSKQTSGPPWDLSQPHPAYNYSNDHHLPGRMPELMQRQSTMSYNNVSPLYRSYNNTNNQHVLRPKALITCQSNCNRVGCCSKDVPRVPQHWNLYTDKSNGNVSRSTNCKGVAPGISQTVTQHTSTSESASRPTGITDSAVKEFPQFHRDVAGSDHLGSNIPQFKNDITSQHEGSILKQNSVTSGENAINPKKDASAQCQRSCAPNCQQYDHQDSKFSVSGQTPLNMTAPTAPNQWLCDSQTRMWSLPTKQSQCLMPLEGIDMSVNNPVPSNYWLERTREKPSVPVPTSKSSYQDIFEYQIHQEQHQKYTQQYQDPDRLKMMERARYHENLRSSQPEPSDWVQDIPRRRNVPPCPVPRYANVNTNTRVDHDPLAVNQSLPPTYPYTHSKVPPNYTDPTQYSARFSSTYTQAQSKMIPKSNNGFNPHVHSTHTTNIVPANCVRPTIIHHQPPHFAVNVDLNAAQTGKSFQYVSSAQSFNNQSYTSCNEVYNNVNFSKTMQVVDKPCLNNPRMIQPYSMYDKNIDPFYKNMFGQNTRPVARNLIYDKNMTPRQVIYDQSYNTENLQSTASHQQYDNYIPTYHTTRPTQENVAMLGSHSVSQNALFGQQPTAILQGESERFTLVDGSDRPIKKRKPQLGSHEKPLRMDLRQFIETWEEEPEDVSYQTLPDTDSNKVDLRGGSGGRPTLEETNADSNIIKLYQTDSDEIQPERNSTGSSVIKPINKSQQSSELHTRSSEKLDLQELNLPLKSTVEVTTLTSGILQNLLPSSEMSSVVSASPVGEFLSDEPNGRHIPQIVPGRDNLPPGSQLSCDFEQRKPLTDSENLKQILPETKCSKSIVRNDDTHSLLPNGKQRMQVELKDSCHTPLTENVNTRHKQGRPNDVNLKSVGLSEGENVNRTLSEPVKSNTQSFSSTSIDFGNTRNLMNVENFEQILPKCSSVHVTNSHKTLLKNAPLADDKDMFNKSIESSTENDKLSEYVASKPSSSTDIGNPTKPKPKHSSVTQVKSNVPKVKSISTNLPEDSVNPLLQVAKISHRSSSRPRPLSRKRKSFPGTSTEGEATVEDKSSRHIISSPIKTAGNACSVQKMHTDGIEMHLKESLNLACQTLESALTINRSVDCLAKMSGNNAIHEVACTSPRTDSNVSGFLPIPLTKTVAVSSTSAMERVSPQSAYVQNNSELSNFQPLLKELSDKNTQHEPVIVSNELLMKSEVVNFTVSKSTSPDISLAIKSSSSTTSQPTGGLPVEINPIPDDECNAIHNVKATILGDKGICVQAASYNKSHQSNVDDGLHSSAHISLKSNDLAINETMCRLPEKVSPNLHNVVCPLLEISSAVAPSPSPLDGKSLVNEKSMLQVDLTEDPKIALLKQNEDSDAPQFTECDWLTRSTIVNPKKTAQFGQSQQENITGNDGSSKINANKPFNSLSVSSNSNTYDCENNNQVETIKTVGCQSLEKCSNSVIRYISSEVLDESCFTKDPIVVLGLTYQHNIKRINSSSNAVEPCVEEQSKRPVELTQTDSVTSNKAIKMQERVVVHDGSKKSKLLSVRIVKKNCNQYNICSSNASATGTDKQPKECSTVKSANVHNSPPEKPNESIEHELYDLCDEPDVRSVEFSNSLDDEVNGYETKASPNVKIKSHCQASNTPYAGKQIGMTEESQPSNTKLEHAVDLNIPTVKLPQNKETQSQQFASSYESSNDVLDLDASYDYDMQTEGESHSINKESLLYSGSKHISAVTENHKSVNLESNDEEDGNIINVDTSCNDSNMVKDAVALARGDEAKTNLNAAACITNVRTSFKTISKLNVPSTHPTVNHERKLLSLATSSYPEENVRNHSELQLNTTTDLIETKNISLNPLHDNDFPSQSFSKCNDKILHPVKTTLLPHDGPIACDESTNRYYTELSPQCVTLQGKVRNLLEAEGPHSTSKRSFSELQQTSFKSSCDNDLKLTCSDTQEVTFTTSDKDTNFEPVLDKPNVITDAHLTVDSSVLKTVRPNNLCNSDNQEQITLISQNPENVENCKTSSNESQSQTNEYVASTEESVSLPVGEGQRYGIKNFGNVVPSVQENTKRECYIEDLSKIINFGAQTGNIGDVASTDDNLLPQLKDKMCGGECLVEDKERDQTCKDSDVDLGQPSDEGNHSMCDSLGADLPSRDGVQSLVDLCSRATANTEKFSMPPVVVNISCDNKGEITKRTIIDCEIGNASVPAINETQCSIEDDSGTGTDLKVGTVEEVPVNNGTNLTRIIQDNRNYEPENALVKPLPSEKDKLSVEDNASVIQSRDEQSMDTSFHKSRNDNAGFCLTGNASHVKMDRLQDEHSSDCHSKHNSDVPVHKEEDLMDGDLDLQSSHRHEEHPINLNQTTNSEVNCQPGRASSVEIDEVEHSMEDDLSGQVSNNNNEHFMDDVDKIEQDNCKSSDASCVTENKQKCSTEDEVGVPVKQCLMNSNDIVKHKYHRQTRNCSREGKAEDAQHLMEDKSETSIDKGEAHLVDDNKDSRESGYVSHVTRDINEHSVQKDIGLCMLVNRDTRNFIHNNSNKIIDADDGDSQTGIGLYVGTDTDEDSKKHDRPTCESVGNNKKLQSKLDNYLDVTVLENDIKSSMNDESSKLVEEDKPVAGDALIETHCTFIIDTNSESGDLATLDTKAKSATSLLPIGIEHSAPGEQVQPPKAIICSNWGSGLSVPCQERNDVDATTSSFSSQSHLGFNKLQVANYTTTSEKSVQESTMPIDDLIHKHSNSNHRVLCKETNEAVLKVNTSFIDPFQEVEREVSMQSYEDPANNELQTRFKGIEAKVKSTPESSLLHELPDGLLDLVTKGQNHFPLVLNSEPCTTPEEEAVKIDESNRDMCDEDILSNSSDTPEMPFLEVISDLKSSTDEIATSESHCDSDTEMPLLEKFTNSPIIYPEEKRLNTTVSKLNKENDESITDSSGEWNSVAQPEVHCPDANCIDLIPVDSVSNWPYLEEEVFSEAQISGSPQVELNCSGPDYVPSDQRMTSSSDTETEPDSLNVPSTNTALDIVRYSNREIDVENECLNVPASSADLKCRLSWKKIFNLAKVEEQKKQHRVGEAKNRKEAYRRWPYYGKTGHKRRSLKNSNKVSNSIGKFGKGDSSVEMSSSDVDGLVLGPAKIEFRLAPKSHTERWQVVDGSKALNLSGEENNNVTDRSVAKTLKTQSPIVLVKRIILKRRGDDNYLPKKPQNVSQNYSSSTSMSTSPNQCLNINTGTPISSATLTIPSIPYLNEANCESEFNCLATPSESDDSSTSLKTLERLPKVIIKRTGYGNAKYKSFLRLSAAEGSNWQPFVRLERKKYLDHLAKQLFSKRDLTNEDNHKPTQRPIPFAFSMEKQLQEVDNGSSIEEASTYKVIPTNPEELTLPESVLAKSVDLHQEDVSNKLYKGTYTAVKRHSKDTKLTFQLSNTNKQCTEVCSTDKKVKQGIVNNHLTETCELDKCQERVLKTVKHSVRRCSEGGTFQEKKKPEPKYRERIGSEGANSGALKPKKRSANESNNGALWYTDENKSKFPKTKLKDMECVQSTGEQYNTAPEKAVAKEYKWKKSLKQKLRLITCKVCNYSIKNKVDQSAHIRQHPYHCQKCSLAFKSEDDFKSHLSVEHPLTRELHHCLLCKLSFPTAKQHEQHMSDRQHQYLDLTQRWTIQTLFKMFTGEGCSRITPLTESEEADMSKLTDAEPGAINYYHQATPLQLAVQDLLKQRKLPDAGVPVSSPRTHQDDNDA